MNDRSSSELTDAEKIILDLYGQDAQEGDCIWGGNMTVGFARARSLGIRIEEFNRAGDSLVLEGYLEIVEGNSYRLSKKGFEAKSTGTKQCSNLIIGMTADLDIVEDLS